MLKYILGVACILGFAFPASAQTTAGVFGPNIREGDRSAEWRIAASPGENAGSARWESRLHYQYAFQDDVRARIVVQGSDIETGRFESNFLQAELQWQFKKQDSHSSWASALRLDARLVEKDDGVNGLGLNWANQWNPVANWQFNSVVLTAIEVGNASRDGVVLEVRNGVKYKVKPTMQIGIESFSVLGRTNSLGNFNTQNHRIGPVVTGKFNEKTNYLIGALFGASRPARDLDFRLWLTRSF
ncbi:MAG: hypothetical protein L3J05_09370 [Robiginitomaculum sp.]|nr:hypothetical protein [Robiginitomaculum sp.]